MNPETLTKRFVEMLDISNDNPEDLEKIYKMIEEAPESGERDGLLALIYHEGIGVDIDLEKSFEYAEKAAFESGDPLGYYLLGYMCDNAETPDQAEGGPRQKYDHYDAERFYEICSQKESHWKIPACHWLGDYYINFARGGDPEIGVEYYEKIANEDADAAGKLSDYYWDVAMPDNTEDEYWTIPLFKWTKVAVELKNDEYLNRLGMLYADGIGCKKSIWLALKYFSEALFLNDWRGADSIAGMIEEYEDKHQEMTSKEKKECLQLIISWRKHANELKRKEDEDDPDNSEEED